MSQRPPQVLDAEQDASVTLDLFQVLALVAQQALVVLVAWQDVDRAPEAGPTFEAAQSHVGGDQAGGDADGHSITTFSTPKLGFTPSTKILPQ